MTKKGRRNDTEGKMRNKLGKLLFCWFLCMGQVLPKSKIESTEKKLTPKRKVLWNSGPCTTTAASKPCSQVIKSPQKICSFGNGICSKNVYKIYKLQTCSLQL